MKRGLRTVRRALMCVAVVFLAGLGLSGPVSAQNDTVAVFELAVNRCAEALMQGVPLDTHGFTSAFPSDEEWPEINVFNMAGVSLKQELLRTGRTLSIRACEIGVLSRMSEETNGILREAITARLDQLVKEQRLGEVPLRRKLAGREQRRMETSFLNPRGCVVRVQFTHITKSNFLALAIKEKPGLLC
ncbi:MAG: hypothetical protein ACPG7W_04825, partial [Paracoccaceae bacterium]